MKGQDIHYVQGSTVKVEQIVGDFDRENQQNTRNKTNSRYQIWGTDLGVSFNHDGKTFFLFGDIPGDIGFGIDRDPIAFTTDNDPSNGLDLTFLTQSSNKYNPINIPGISHGAFDVPIDGVSINGNMYIYFLTNGMDEIVLAKSEDNGKTFSLIKKLFQNQFTNLSINKVRRSDYPGLPGNFSKGLMVLGTKEYRKSPVYLYCHAEDAIADKTSYFYFTGLTGNKPNWSNNENKAVPIIDINCGGELSSAFEPLLKKWMVLYNCDNPRGIQIKFSDTPWGPYSNAETIFEPDVDNGYCHFIHASWQVKNCDNVHDPGRENEWGGEYGPYLLKNKTTKQDSFYNIYYTLSTWNPYTTVLMKSTLQRTLSTSVPKAPPIKKVKVTPNPANHQLVLNIPNYIGKEMGVVITNVKGENYLEIRNKTVIDLKDTPSGVYVGRVFLDRIPAYYFRFLIVH